MVDHSGPVTATSVTPVSSLQEQVEGFTRRQEWVQDIELPGGIRTRPDIPDKTKSMIGKWRRLKPIFDSLGLEGKSVLDVGCNEGFFSLQAAARGAQAFGVDLDPLRIEKALFVARALDEPRVRFEKMDIYSEAFDRIGNHDVALMIGMLHRLPDPYRALEAVAARTDLLILEWKTFRWGPSHGPYAYYDAGRNEQGELLHPRYWRLTQACVQAMLNDLGFPHVRPIEHLDSNRTLLLAGRRAPAVLKPHHGDVQGPSRTTAMRRATREYLRSMQRALTKKG